MCVCECIYIYMGVPINGGTPKMLALCHGPSIDDLRAPQRCAALRGRSQQLLSEGLLLPPGVVHEGGFFSTPDLEGGGAHGFKVY